MWKFPLCLYTLSYNYNELKWFQASLILKLKNRSLELIVAIFLTFSFFLKNLVRNDKQKHDISVNIFCGPHIKLKEKSSHTEGKVFFTRKPRSRPMDTIKYVYCLDSRICFRHKEAEGTWTELFKIKCVKIFVQLDKTIALCNISRPVGLE